MLNSGKIIGILLIGAGVIAGILAAVWGLTNVAEGTMQITGFVFLLILALPFIAALVGAGIYMFLRGRSEEAELAEVAQERKLLNMIQTQGEVRIADAAIELDASRETVKNYVYDLVGKGLFSGYINWDDGVLFAREARSLRETGQCPNCGGELELAGKGVIQCPYCGSEIFL